MYIKLIKPLQTDYILWRPALLTSLPIVLLLHAVKKYEYGLTHGDQTLYGSSKCASVKIICRFPVNIHMWLMKMLNINFF